MARRRDAKGQQLFDFSPRPPEPDTPQETPPVEPTPGPRQALISFDAPTNGHAAPADDSPPPATNGHVEANGHVDLPTDHTTERQKARDILAAIRTLKLLELEKRQATPEEHRALSRFCGFGPVALTLFPDPLTGRYKDASWQALGEELRQLLTAEEYDSAKRTVFNAFYTSSTVIKAMFQALHQLGVPDDGKILEPGCGPGRFPLLAPKPMRFIGVELDSISGRIAKALHPQHDIRIENFRDTRLPQLDGVIGNVPFANISLDHHGKKLSLHDYFLCKSTEALRPGGILAVVTSHFSLDRQNGIAREYLADQADFLGAIRLPSTAFKNEGTAVVTDIVFFRKRGLGQEPNHADPDWLKIEPMEIDGATVPINKYFLNHPEQVLGRWSRQDTLYGEGYSVVGSGDLAEQLREAVRRLPRSAPAERTRDSAASNGIDPSKSGFSAPAQFTPPPPLKHLSEGSLFIGDDTRIYQIVDGQGQPLVYGGSHVWDHGAVTGRRIGSQIRLRDLWRQVLRSQNEGWPEAAREEARRELNRAYDRFVFTFGPINKTTFHETKDGTTIRRMPNLGRFREDPDAMGVMSLEEYDEETGTARKAPIMYRDVVGKAPAITYVETAEEGLLVSLNQHGAVDLAFIAQLYGKPEEQVISELGDLIYQDPVSKEWQTADAYLSGNVREKLRQAEAAGYERNAEALRAVQPEDVLPGDIDCNLGCPWCPESDIQDFAAYLFGVPADGISVAHLKKDATWSLEAGYSAEQSVAAKSEYGTARANGTWLLEKSLNMQSPVIYDPDPDDSDRRVVNQEETLAAKEKQKLIKERFKSWVFSDPDRAERLVRIYNDIYNNLRPRLFDGSHLTFPGMNEAFQLRQHQKDAVWRIMSAGNTLVAHCVGGGKSAVLAAAAMKLKQTGLRKKILIAVPNHLLEQFAREFQQWYPNAKLLIASKDDFTKERRKYLTAKIASGDWDAIIVTHSSFERIGMSREYQERFLNEQIAEYEELLHDAGSKNAAKAKRNLIKQIEKQKAARETKLKDLLAEDKKDDGLVFDDLGIDQLFIDEFHAYKRLETPSKMERVAGIPSGGSERAFDLYMKARYLDQKNPGHGLVGATGTPITNTLAEMYILQRYFDPEGLKQRGIDHFDAWAGNFGEVTEQMEISPDGKTLKSRSRFANLVNYADLELMYRSFADVQTAEMLKLPRPRLAGGKPQVVSCPMSDDQDQQQQGLVKRYERIRNGRVDPREDNALAITTDGRKLALDARMLDAEAPFNPDSKIEAMLDRVVERWQRTHNQRGTQMIFCDMGINPTDWGYSVYEQIIEGLVKKGIPQQEIATIGEADSDAKKRSLFDKVRAGQVRVLIGSTQKMGMGTNVQKRLGALHELDAPWRPDEVEQREGRILRQGNENEEVTIYRYVTEGSFDAFMWQALETKARSFAKILSGQSGLRRVEDISGQELDYATVKSIASGNPGFLVLAEADAELQRLSILRKSHLDEQFMTRRALKELPGRIDDLTKRIGTLSADQATMQGNDSILVAGRPAGDVLAALEPHVDRLPLVMKEQRVPLGVYHGLKFGVILSQWRPEVYLEGTMTRREMLAMNNPGPRAVLNGVERLAKGYQIERAYAERDLEIAEAQLRDYQAREGKPFEYDGYLRQLADLRDQLRIGLSGTGQEEVAGIAEKIKALRSSHQVEAAPERTAKRKVEGETPVTARIMSRNKETEKAEATGEDEWQRRMGEKNGWRR